MEKNYFISFLTHTIRTGNQKDRSMSSMSSYKKIVKRQQVEAGHSVLIVTERQISEQK